MENKKESKDDVEEYINRIVTPIFDRVLKEVPANRMSVREVGAEKKDFCFFCPHNYRLYITFQKINFKYVQPTSKGSVRGRCRSVGSVQTKLNLPYTIKNHTEMWFEDVIPDVTIVVKKTQVEIRNKINNKQNFSIPITENARDHIKPIIEKKDAQCIAALRRFIELYGGKSDFKILKRFSENKTTGTNEIDAIDAKVRWHGEISKKVYNEKNVEFYDPSYASNHIENSAIQSKTPELREEIQANREMIKDASKLLSQYVTGTTPILQDFTVNIKTHNSVLKNINSSFKKFSSLLSLQPTFRRSVRGSVRSVPKQTKLGDF